MTGSVRHRWGRRSPPRLSRNLSRDLLHELLERGDVAAGAANVEPILPVRIRNRAKRIRRLGYVRAVKTAPQIATLKAT